MYKIDHVQFVSITFRQLFFLSNFLAVVVML